jgi:hypothetical protein
MLKESQSQLRIIIKIKYKLKDGKKSFFERKSIILIFFYYFINKNKLKGQLA